MNIKNKINGIKEIWQFSNRWQLLANRLFFSHENINIYRYGDLEILVDHSAGDANGARELLTSDMYRRFFPKMELPAEITLLDLGSNNGGFPLLLKSENIGIKKLVCVEFNPKTFARMRFNIERNLECSFVALNLAVSGKDEMIDVEFGKTSTSDNLFKENTNSSANVVNVQGATFNKIYQDYFGDEEIDICKMDIEGAEFEVFGGNDFDLLKNCRFLLIEIHHEKETPRTLVQDKILGLGFEEIDGDSKDDDLHYVHLYRNKKAER